MRNLFTAILSLTFAALAPAQDYGWAMRAKPQSPGEASGFFPIGWSADGRLFAYATFDYSISVAASSNLSVSVRDMVTDKVVWWFTRGWKESLRGDESDPPPPPGSAGVAWEQVADEIVPHLRKYGIAPGGPAMAGQFPLEEGGDALTLEIEENGDGGFTVRVNSEKLGSKVIARENKADTQNRLSVLGYYRSPQGPRLAVVLREDLYNRWGYSNYYVIGCHLKSGFRK
jgi:hypothetical protein